MEKEFRKKVNEYLNRLNSTIEKAIKELTCYEFPKEVVHLDFEIFSDSFTEGSPIRVFFLDKDNTEFFIYVDGKAEYPSPIDTEIFNIDYLYPISFEKEFENKIEGYDPWKMTTEEFIKWFSNKWKSCLDKKFNLKATIGHHDSWEKFDLIEQKWIKSQF